MVVFLAAGLFPAILLWKRVDSGQSANLLRRNARLIVRALETRGALLHRPAPPASSTAVFNDLIAAGLLRERDFWVPGFAPAKRRPDGDGVLQAEENPYVLVWGLDATAPADAPWIGTDPRLHRRDRPWGKPRFARWEAAWIVGEHGGRVHLRRRRPPAWWDRMEEPDLLPGVPGTQRLLTP